MESENYLNWMYGFDEETGTFEVVPDKKYEKPATFFKYYALSDNSVEALTNLYVYASHPAQLNDPFDCDSDLAKIEDESNAKAVWESLYETVRQTYTKDSEFFQYTTAAFSSVMFSKWGVLSLTDQSDSMVMWSLYAQNNGFCLEWDVSQFPFSQSGPFPIHYVQKIDCASSLKYNAATLALIQSNIKLDCWNYENEWRLMIQAPMGFGLKMFGKFSDRFNESHPDAHDRKFKYPICALKSITLGVNFFKNIKEEGRIMLNPHSVLHACYKSVCNETKVLDFLDKLDSQYISVKVYLKLKDGLESLRVPIIVKKIGELTYRIIEIP